MGTTVIGRRMGENVEETRIALRVDALPALRDAARAGMGLALLPCYLADKDEQLRRAPSAAVSDVRSALWLLTHNDLRRTADPGRHGFSDERARFGAALF